MAAAEVPQAGDVVICGESALRYWRTPPVMRAMTSGSRQLVPVETSRLALLQHDAHIELPFYQACEASPKAGRPVGDPRWALLRQLSYRLAPSLVAPVDVAVSDPDERRRSKLLHPTVVPESLLEGNVVPAAVGAFVCSPALTLLQLAARLDEVRLLMVATELCGCFSVYRAAPCLARMLEELRVGGWDEAVLGWRATFSRDGALTDLWSRPAPTNSDELRDVAQQAWGRRGSRRLARVAELLVPGAASPLEARAGILLGLSPRYGGMGLGGFSHNERVDLDDRARALAGRDVCYCDLYWPGHGLARALDLECHSASFHLGEAHELSDADRSLALQSMGIEVAQMTNAQLTSLRRFDALAEMVAAHVGRDLPERDAAFLARRATLRRIVLSDWEGAAYGQ